MHFPIARLAGLALLALFLVLPAAAQELTVTTFAGTPGGGGLFDGFSPDGRLMGPRGVAVDAGGNVYVADTFGHTVRKITAHGGMTTLAGKPGVPGTENGHGGAARLSFPRDVAVDGSGNVYVSDNGGLRRISPEGLVETFAPDGGSPIAVDSSGNVYTTAIVGPSRVIKKIAPDGTPATLTGVAVSGFIHGLAVTSTGQVLYTTDGTLHRRNTNGTVTPVASGGFFAGVAVEPSGNYIVIGTQTINRVTPGGSVTMLAGNGQTGQEDGFGGIAKFLFPNDVFVAPDGGIYIAEELSQRIRHLSASNVVSTVAGVAAERGFVNGPRLSARFFEPVDAVRDSNGNLFVAERLNCAIRKITPAGDVTTFTGGNGPGSTDGNPGAAKFWELSGIAADAANNLYVTDASLHNVRKITPAGVVSTVAGLANNSGNTNGTGTAARFSQPVDLVAEADGTLYVADFSNNAIRKITPAGVVSTFATVTHPSGITRTSDGTLYVTTFDSAIMKITVPGAVVTTFAGMPGQTGEDDGTGTAARFHQLGRIAADGLNNLFVVDTFALRKITPAAVVTTVAGARLAERTGHISGTGADARFMSPRGMFAWGDSNLYLADGAGNNVRYVRPPGIEDVATISTPVAPLGVAVQLGTSHAGATSWHWRVLRRPVGSVAQFSSAGVREPVFSPDVADLYVFELRAEGPAGVRYSRVELTGTSNCEPMPPVAITLQGESQVCLNATGATVTSNVSGNPSEVYQWGWRSTPGGSITYIDGANASSYVLDGQDFGGTTGKKYLVLSAFSNCGFRLLSNEIAITVVAPPSAAINASTRVPANSTMNYASVPDAGAGATYAWTISGGTIDAGQGTRLIRYTAGANGQVVLGVTVTNGCPATGEATVIIRTPTAGASLFYMVTPCRVLDTRSTAAVADGGTLTVTVGGKCGIPVGAKAAVVNLTAVTPPAAGFASLFRFGTGWPGTSTLSYRAGRTRANNALVEVAADGKISLRNVGASTHFLIDVTGYFQ